VARDLIPPPSPAGRPAPDAGRLIELPPEPVAEPAAAPPNEPIGPSRHRHRFGFITGALIGLLIASVALVVVVLVNSRDTSKDGLAAHWSGWQPAHTDADSGAAEIAKHVGNAYRLDDGTQLVVVQGRSLDIQVALQPVGGNISLLNGHAIVYTLNGLGPNGSILTGKPSNRRGVLLRREALELALYSFRYLNKVDMVLALLPPPPPQKGKKSDSLAVFYRPGDLLPQLKVPLGSTLASRTLRPKTVPRAEAQRVLSLTNANVFEWNVRHAQDGTALLVLNRPS
jgi:hypothetical protein